MLKENQLMERARLKNSIRRIFFASGFLTCGECGRAMVGQSAHGKNQIHRYYTHASKIGDTIDCTIKRVRADEIETALENYLAEILVRAGHFERVSENIKKLFASSPGQIKAERLRLQKDLEDVQTDIRRTFKMQSTLAIESEAIKLTAEELELLGQKKRALQTQLENVLSREGQSNDYQECIVDLKERIEAFNRGWAKASPAMKKQLLRNLLVAVVVVPDGLRITYRLAHAASIGGQSSAGQEPNAASSNVVALTAKRPDLGSSPALISNFSACENESIQNLQVAGFGSPQPMLFEHLGYVKTYPVRWNHDPKFDIAELAVKRFIERWPRQKLLEHFALSPVTVSRWATKLKRQDFKFDLIPPELQIKLRAAANEETQHER